MSVLVTGGGGYIGSHVVRLLNAAGHKPVIVDDFATGFAERVFEHTSFRLDLAEPNAVSELHDIMTTEDVTAVIHFAARKQVGQSVDMPEWYYLQNINSLANVLLAMKSAGVQQIVFSSSAAVYGSPEGGLVSEASPPHPVNPYGETKLIGEWLLEAASTARGISAVALRYFNVAGAGWPELGDRMALNLIPMAFERIDQGQPPLVFGTDYPTPDGSCVRDYIHVMDLARAHLAALEYKPRTPGLTRFNVGTGAGTSVLEVLEEIRKASGDDFGVEVRPRRPGDPAAVVADPSALMAATGWRATFGIEEIVSSAWQSKMFFSHEG